MSTSSSVSDSASASIVEFVNHSPEELLLRRDALKDESYVHPYSEVGSEKDRYVNHFKKYKFDFNTFEMVNIRYLGLDFFTDPKPSSIALG